MIRPAIVFLAIFVLVFSSSIVLGSSLYDDETMLYAGVISIAIALLYILAPVLFNRVAVFFLWCAPLAIAGFIAGIVGLCVIGAIGGIILMFPLGLGIYLLIYANEQYGGIGVVLASAIFITIWIFCARYQWRFLRRFTRSGLESLERITAPLWKDIEKGWEWAEEWGNWIKDR